MISVLALAALLAVDFRPPAGNDSVSRRPGASSVLPGGRLIDPIGVQFATGPGSFGLAISPSGRWIATSGGGPNRYTLTVLERVGYEVKGVRFLRAKGKGNRAAGEEADSESVFQGLAFLSDTELLVSEGKSGRVRMVNPANGKLHAAFDLNRASHRDSYSGDLAVDRSRGLLYVLDQKHFRLAVIDVRKRAAIASLNLGALPLAIELSPDGKRAYIANTGLTIADIAEPTKPSILRSIDLKRSGAAGIAATETHVFVSNADQDSIAVIDAPTLARQPDIELRVPGLEGLRGIQPVGLTFDPARNWLLTAQAGINAIGVIDVASRKAIGHLPAAWFPTRVAIFGDMVHTANARGFGDGPNATLFGPLDATSRAEMRRGAVTIARLPAGEELASQTRRVWELNGFLPVRESAPPIPSIQHVVLIVKQGRTFDDVFGDVDSDYMGRPVRSAPELARFGRRGVLDQLPGELRQRVQSKYLNVTPNHHALADSWAISDNFYADGALAEASLTNHLRESGVSIESFPESGTNVTDRSRVERFIQKAKAIETLPRFVSIHLPNDRMERPRPEDGLPFEASFIADNDYALGQLVEYLSSRPEWKSMAILITEAGTQGGIDHIDAHRTVLIAAGPYVKKNYVSRVNSSFPGLMKTIFRLLGVPPLNLDDAAAADLSEAFTDTPDFAPYTALPASKELLEP